MEPLTSQQIQILRTMDKHDSIGTAGVVKLLQKPESEFGAGLDPTRARMIGDFMDTKGADNAETLANMRDWFARAEALRDVADAMLASPVIASRCEMLCALDDDVVMDDGSTGLDYLMQMPENADATWSNGGRPNIAWALDDILRTAADAGVDKRGRADYARSVLLAARETKET